MAPETKEGPEGSSSSTPLTDLKNTRKHLKSAMNRILLAIENIVEMPAHELECRLGVLESYYKQCCDTQLKIESLEPLNNLRAEIDELFIITKSKLLIAMSACNRSSLNESSQASALPSCQRSSFSMLPAPTLPTFNGKYSEFKSFAASFKRLVHDNNALGNTEKFDLLRQCLKDQALEALSQFPNTNENYIRAYDRLFELYDNDCLIFLEHVNAVFEATPISKPTQASLRTLIDKVSASYSAMKTLGTHEQICDAFIINILMKKVDQATRNQWQECLEFKTLPVWKSCNSFLDRRCQRLEAAKISTNNLDKSSATGKPSKPSTHQASGLSCALGEPKPKTCALCRSQDHWLYRCTKFADLPVAERLATVKQLDVCFNCLGQGHIAAKCKSKYSCKNCKSKHHTLLHLENNTDAATEAQSLCTAACQLGYHSSNVILATAFILVKDGNGEYQLARVLLDSCSQVNFIRSGFAQSLRLKITRHQLIIDGINSCQTTLNKHTQTTIRSRLNGFTADLECVITPTVSNYKPNIIVDAANLNIPKNIELADPYFNQSQRIDMLIGGEIFFDLLSVGQIKLGDGMPTLQKTTLGWLVVGCIAAPNHSKSIQVTTQCTTSSIDTLEALVKRFWQLEEVGRKTNQWTDEQSQCEKFYVNTVKTLENGRIVVRLPLKANVTNLGASYETALRRFRSLEHRLSNNETIREQYVMFMREYESLNHMAVVSGVDLNQPHYYIPHHCVLKPTSSTTKLRVVFDASCKTTSGTSLNDVMMVGPTIQNQLLVTLLNFRTHLYGLTADITKMYRQVVIDSRDYRFQLILWRESKNQPVKTYALKTVTYGTAAAPFLAIRSLQLAAQKCMNAYPIGSATINSDFYVDDLLSGAESIDALLSIKREVSTVLKKSGFDITKWKSNYKYINSSMELKLLKMDSDVTSALGVLWDPSTDELSFVYQPKMKHTVCSKRSILSHSSSLFDPMGLVSPLLIRAKLLFQDLWKQEISWDESPPQAIMTAWQNLTADLQTLHRIKIPRHFLTANMTDLQIHGFCDASMKAYGCVLYARATDHLGEISSRIIVAKSRVAPSKTKTVPRLELCGALLLTRLWGKLAPSLKVSPSAVYFWSDSQVVLHLLKLQPSTLATFVSNRVAEIQESTSDIKWTHVPSDQNPADLVSRGCTVDDFLNSSWLSGPTFLLLHSDHWPSTSQTEFPDEGKCELKRSVHICHDHSNPLLQTVHNISNYQKLLNIFAYIHRFIKVKCKNETVISPLISLQEMSAALKCVVSLVQHHHFAKEIHLLAKSQSPSATLKSLAPFIDASGSYTLIRVGGRLRNADISYGTKHQMLLPNTDPFVSCILRHFHRANYHAGPQALVAATRELFWIINARSAASKVVNGCVQCVRYRPRLMQQIMGDLPRHRVTMSRPFQHCGVDFFGPVLTYLNLRGKVPYKSYVAVFICFATKAVHLEAVSDLSSNKFIEALKRMVGRRGLPQQIFCDNATNFIGADRKLKAMRDEFFKTSNIDDAYAYCAANNIQFNFIPPRAPHFGGLWEAAVKVAKGHLLRSLSHARLTYEELSTALIEIEAIMNSRPLCPASSNPNDLEAITPGQALIGSPLKAIPEPVTPDSDVCHLKRFQRINAIKAQFWQRWHVEYLHQLQNRVKWKNASNELKAGDMVLIHDDNQGSMNWPIARVERVIKGSDGHARVAELRTARGTIKRSIVKLVLLPEC